MKNHVSQLNMIKKLKDGIISKMNICNCLYLLNYFPIHSYFKPVIGKISRADKIMDLILRFTYHHLLCIKPAIAWF